MHTLKHISASFSAFVHSNRIHLVTNCMQFEYLLQSTDLVLINCIFVSLLRLIHYLRAKMVFKWKSEVFQFKYRACTKY